MEQFLELLESNYVTLGIIVSILIMFFLLIIINTKYTKLQKIYRKTWFRKKYTRRFRNIYV